MWAPDPGMGRIHETANSFTDCSSPSSLLQPPQPCSCQEKPGKVRETSQRSENPGDSRQRTPDGTDVTERLELRDTPLLICYSLHSQTHTLPQSYMGLMWDCLCSTSLTRCCRYSSKGEELLEAFWDAPRYPAKPIPCSCTALQEWHGGTEPHTHPVLSRASKTPEPNVGWQIS